MHNRHGFTIVELLVVIVVIAILAAVSIVAYNGINQRSATASINSSVSQWSKLIQTASIGSGFSVSANTCLGSSANDFPAANGFSAGSCVTVDGTSAVSYTSSVFASWPTSPQRPSGSLPLTQTVIGGSTYKARGIWAANTSSDAVELRWIPQIANECAVGNSIAAGSQGSTSGGICSYVLFYSK